MDNLQILNNALVANNACEEFYKNYNNQEFRNWIQKILPQIEDCKNQRQDNPWHIYGCLDHILHAVEAMNKQTISLDSQTRKMLSYVMLLHDIAKPACHIRRYANAYKRYVDSFFGHAKLGEQIAREVLPTFGFCENEVKIMTWLVKNHDIFMNLTITKDPNPHKEQITPQLVKNLLQEADGLGEASQIVRWLVMVGRADNLAQNPKMTKQSLDNLDYFESVLDNVVNNSREGV